MRNPLANDLTWAAQCMRPEVVEVGLHDEKYLIDFMADGSKMALLHFDMSILALAKRRNAHLGMIVKLEQEVADRAKQVRERVFKAAFKALRANRKVA